MDGYTHFIDEATAGESPLVNKGFLEFLFSIQLLLWSLLSLKSPFQVTLKVLLPYTSSSKTFLGRRL